MWLHSYDGYFATCLERLHSFRSYFTVASRSRKSYNCLSLFFFLVLQTEMECFIIVSPQGKTYMIYPEGCYV